MKYLIAVSLLLLGACQAEQSFNQGDICCKQANGGTQCMQPLPDGACPAGTS
jgi:hypothetical protein